MKILHILGELRPSGAEVMLRKAAPLWCSNSVSLQILCTGDNLGPYAPELLDAGYCIHHIPFDKSPAFFLKLFRLLKNERYDVVHIHTERANFYYGLISKLLGVPKVIRTVHATFPFTGWLGFKRKCHRWGLRKMGIVQISIGQSVAEVERKHFQNPTIIIPNWYDDDYFRPPTHTERSEARALLGCSPDTEVFVSVGNCSPVKNHPELIKALAEIHNTKYIYLHIGLEVDESERALAQKYQIAKKIRFLGFQKNIRSYLWGADVFIMPSLHEGFGIAAVEAMACHLPAILTHVPGLMDLEHDVPGIVWAEPFADSLVEAIQKMERKPFEIRDQEADWAATVVREKWSARIGAECYRKIYNL